MKHPFNCMGLLALPALAALLFLPTRDPAFLGFLGFLVFLRYFWVNPDELFLLTLRQAATAAFVVCIFALPQRLGEAAAILYSVGGIGCGVAAVALNRAGKGEKK